MKNKIIFLTLNLLMQNLAFSMELNQVDKYKLDQELVEACKNNQIERVESLVQAGADVNARNLAKSALSWASEEGHKKMVELLVKAGADVNSSHCVLSALYAACKKGHIEIVELLIKAGANHKNGENLYIASQNGHKEVVELLIKSGTDINWKTEECYTPLSTTLMTASYSGHNEIVELLIKAGTDINFKNSLGWTALMYASNRNHKEIIEIINNGIIKRKEIDRIKQELFKKIEEGNFDQVKELLKKVTWNIRDEKGNNLLHLAMMAGSLELTKLIFSLKPELIAQVNKNGQTPLSFIGAHGQFIELFRSLVLNQDNNKNNDN